MTTTTMTKGRERQEKILQAIYAAADGSTKYCAYEDVVVQAWKMWPEEFGLRGYVDQYPDSSDLHKPLYGPMKREGWVRNSNKRFALTAAGLALVERLLRGDQEQSASKGRLDRGQRDEILRLSEAAAARKLPRPESLLDTDLYEFYGVTVRTDANGFQGQLKTVDAMVDAAVLAKDPSVGLERVALVVATRDILRSRFVNLIAARSAAKKRG